MADPDLAVSVVIPARNAAAVIPLQLAALAQQSFVGEWEVIVVDDESTDDTRGAALAARGPLPRLQVIDSGGCRSAAGARNAGARIATGQVLAFCDADDVVSTTWLAALVEACATSDIATGPLDFQTLNHPRLAARWPTFYAEGPVEMGGWLLVPGGCCAVRRDVFAASGGFDERVRWGEDVEFFLRLQQGGHRVAYTPGAVVSVRLRSALRQQFRDGVGHGGAVDPLLPASHEPRWPGGIGRAIRRFQGQPRRQAITRLQTDIVFEAGRTVGRLRRATQAARKSIDP
jgi:glycosyltransferase involved in cell wall biosynthesis